MTTMMGSSRHMCARRSRNAFMSWKSCHRHFFGLANEVQTHSLRTIMKQPADIVYSVIADVQKYPQFVPYCTNCKVISKGKAGEPDKVVLSVGWQQFNEEFESHVKADGRTVTSTASLDNAMFKTLQTTWNVKPVDEKSCRVTFALRFLFRNPVYNAVSSAFGDSVAELMAKAFRERAKDLYEQRLKESVKA